MQRVLANYWMYQIRLGQPTPSLDQIARPRMAALHAAGHRALSEDDHRPPAPLVGDMTSLVGGAWQDRDDAAIIEVGHTLLAELSSRTTGCPNGWLLSAAQAAVNLLWCDPFERFSVVSLIWAPGAE